MIFSLKIFYLDKNADIYSTNEKHSIRSYGNIVFGNININFKLLQYLTDLTVSV